MGSDRVSVKGLEVVGLDKEKNLLVVKGGIPGPTGGLVMVTKLGKIKGYTPPPEEKPAEEEQVESSGKNQESREETGEQKIEEVKDAS